MEPKDTTRRHDKKIRQGVRSADVLFKDSKMHKDAKRPIELWRIMFADATSLLDDPTMNTQEASQLANFFTPKTAMTGNLDEHPMGQVCSRIAIQATHG